MPSVLPETTPSAESSESGTAHCLHFEEHDRIGAVLFDVDGTLYHQKPLRLRMAMELLGLPFATRSIRRARRVWKIISGFRHVREELRARCRDNVPLDELQYLAAAKRVGVPVEEVRDVIRHWMSERPLLHLRSCIRADLPGLLTHLRERDIQLGVFSDYPAREKLVALGVDEFFSLRLAATDSEINAFKPSPEGFLRACSLFDLPPAHVLYVGDREDVDAIGAERAGMPCAILTRNSSRNTPATRTRFKTLSSLSELCHEFHRSTGPPSSRMDRPPCPLLEIKHSPARR